ncbi:NifB/NifX family molybdenum-iron cluster-binding protein [Candidatus Bipolaricaulota bacterium]|nr:NifB/NifX family molybdenum-iron cluster-binding protein [Candidatus Bipolaricaulota bacterium]MBS3814903.1 NifB/NifX family molybdenum-iron cluster-binding protein [Candidatus Bipolaricaulota bacterium]MBS3825948.1 NifB/NifX family molybdenum-iron cluster-binding protein [Candidatus Bipolaricaulota bacterium]
MKIAITATGEDLESNCDGRFGRCSFFVIVDPDSLEYEAIRNSSRKARSGAGIQAAETLAETGADAVATGNVGPNAFNALDSAGLNIYTGASGTVEEVVGLFKNDELTQVNEPTTSGGTGRKK